VQHSNGVTFARRVFLFSGIYGLIVIAPLYFSEDSIATKFPPAITHPEYFYAFLGVTLSFQVLFIILSTDPVRYRPIMIPAMLEKFTYGAAALILFIQHKIPRLILGFATFDMILGLLFVIAYWRTDPQGTKT
jgi:hypothetical protein